MKKNREELEIQLYIAIEENLVNRRKIKDELVTKLQEHNITAGKTMMIFNKSESVPIQTLPVAELYLFTKYLYEATLDNKINPIDWFNPDEIKQYNDYKAQQYYKGDVAVFYNVDQVSENQWICTSEPWVEMSKKVQQGLITYNIRTQRETTCVKFNNVTTEIPTIKQRPIQEMTSLMLKGKFTPNTITLNIRKIGTEIFEYNVKDRTLMVGIDNKRTFLDIPDGMHRTLAGMRAVEANPNLQLFTIINILNYTEEEVQEFIDQEDHRTPINRSHLASFKNDDNGVIVAKYLNKYGNEKNNELFNQIATNDSELKSPYWKYVTIETFAKSFNYNFKIESPREFTKIQTYLKDFFNELIGIFKEKKIPQQICLVNNLFIGYIAMASRLYNYENWKEYLEKIIDQIKLDSKEILSLGINNKNVNLSTVKRISNYFKKIEVIEHV